MFCLSCLTPNSTLLARGEVNQTPPCLQGGRTKLHLARKGGGPLLSTYNITFVPRRGREGHTSSINAPQNDKLKALETEVGPSDSCKCEQFTPHNATIMSLASTPSSPLGLSNAPFSNIQTPVKFSPNNIINRDQMRQNRPKRAIAKSPTCEEKCFCKQINTSNYIFHLYKNVVVRSEKTNITY